MKNRFFLFLACIPLVMLVGGCAGERAGAREETRTAEAFLARYYTVAEYRQAPKSAEEAEKLAEEWQPYLTEEALENFLLNREALRLTAAAEAHGVLLAAGDIAFEPVNEEYGYYTYEVRTRASRGNERFEAVFDGKVRIDEEGMVHVFEPDRAPDEVLETAAT